MDLILYNSQTWWLIAISLNTNICTHYRKSVSSFWELGCKVEGKVWRASAPVIDREMKWECFLWSKEGEWHEMKIELQRTFSCHQSGCLFGVFIFQKRYSKRARIQDFFKKQLTNTPNLVKSMYCTPQKPDKTKWKGRFLITVFESLVSTQQEGNKVDSNLHSRDCGNSIYLCPGQGVIYSHRITFVQLSCLCWILFSARFSVITSSIYQWPEHKTQILLSYFKCHLPPHFHYQSIRKHM